VLFGEAGSGKTTLMAKLAEMLPQWLKGTVAADAYDYADDYEDDDDFEELNVGGNEEGDGKDGKKPKQPRSPENGQREKTGVEKEEGDVPAVVIRFLGTTTSSSTTRGLLTSLVQQLVKLSPDAASVTPAMVSRFSIHLF
jgi:ABC-type cobalamin/Fe3+-siderophores transport system ATPase subunit